MAWRFQWSIAVYRGPSLAELRPLRPDGAPDLTGAAATDLPGRAAADPFLLVRDDGWHLFFEVWNADTNRGEIAHATSPDAGESWIYGSSVLRESFHLSYPHVFSWDGTAYMVPESRQDEAVHLYAAEDFPRGWRRVATLVRGPFADATPFHHDGRWWMFAQRGLDELCLFTSAHLDRGWVPHPLSPLFPGNRRRTRPAGRVLDVGRGLVRFAQDAWPSYGHAVRAFAIDRLTPSDYHERELPASPILRASRHGWNAVAMHHIDAWRRPDGEWLAVVDGATLAEF
jgi:hypothetical protein